MRNGDGRSPGYRDPSLHKRRNYGLDAIELVEFLEARGRHVSRELREMAEAMLLKQRASIDDQLVALRDVIGRHRHDWVTDASGLVDECSICGDVRA